MSIDVSCPSCDKEYKVKDEAAGKKLRCKECQTLIPIPEAAEEADPWESVDEQSQEAWEWDDEEEAALPPVVRAGKKKSAKPSRSRSSGGMPATIIVAIGINGILLAANLYGMLNSFAQAGAGGRTGGGIARLIIEISIIRGLINRSDSARRNSIALDILGLVFIVLLGAFLLFSQRVGGMDWAVLLVLLGVQSVLWIVDMVVLMSPSAKDYCNE